MATEMHNADEHAPFAHRFVITNTTQIFKGGRTEIIVSEFVICCFCGHWIDRPLTEECACIVSCHTDARSLTDTPGQHAA